VALYIKDEGVGAMARELAQLRRCTVTEAVRGALEAERRRLAAEDAAWEAEIKAAAAELRRALGGVPLDHDEMYDEDGNPIL
jgi:hypothetical protein